MPAFITYWPTGLQLWNVTATPNGADTAPRGSLALRTDAGNANLYQNTDAATTWVQFMSTGGGSYTFTADLTYVLNDNSATSWSIGATGDLDMMVFDTTNAAEVVIIGAANGLRLNDSSELRFGTPGTDVVFTPDGTNVVVTATGVIIYNDDVVSALGTTANDRFSVSYNSANTRGQIVGTDIAAGGATQATRPFLIVTGTRTKNDANAGVPGSGNVTVQSGATAMTTAAATGGVSGTVLLGSGATDVTFAAATGGASGAVTVQSGNTDISAAVAATGGASGNVIVQSGNALSTGATATSGASGTVTVASGTSADANTGATTLESGDAAGAGGGITSGGIIIRSGTVGGTGTTGSVNITTGNAAGAGTSGDINLTPGTTVGGTRGQVVALGLRTAQATAVAITGATVLTLADSGGIFNIDQDAAFDIDLPSPTTGPGLRFTFVVGDAGANTVTITVVGGAATFIGNIINDVTSVISITGAETSINIINATAALGDTIEIVSISTTLYLVRAVTSTTGGITAT